MCMWHNSDPMAASTLYLLFEYEYIRSCAGAGPANGLDLQEDAIGRPVEVSGPAPETVLLFPWTQAKAEKLPGHFPPCLVHSSDIDLMVVVDSCHVYIHSQDGAFIECRYVIKL